MALTNKHKEAIQNWYQENIRPIEDLEKKIIPTLDYLKNTDEPNENGEWQVWAYELINGAHGQYVIPMFIGELIGKKVGTEDLDESQMYFTEISERLTNMLNFNKKSLPGEFWIGHHEADGSLGIFYNESAE